MWKFKNLFFVLLENPFKTTSKLKGVFKPLKCTFSCGKHLSPQMWCSKPALIHIVSKDVMWKDKYETPRHEDSPYIWIHLFGYDFLWYWTIREVVKDGFDMDYWEQALWYLYYSNSDLKKAEETWPWTQYHSDESTWDKNYLV